MLNSTLIELNINTTCFSTHIEDDYLPAEGLNIVRPVFSRGYRWDLPNRLLAWQIARDIKRQKPEIIISVGLTALCGHLLRFANLTRHNLWVWELTDAQPGNKFVDRLATQRLNNARGILSPSKTIDKLIRATYAYQGEIRRLPFWIEPGATQYTPSPKRFHSDFLFLSRRENEKGLNDLILAAKLLRSQNRIFKIVIGGIGDKTPFELLTRENNLDSMISFVDLHLREQAMMALENTKFLVLPSHHEGFPISILESTQRSIPVITTKVGAIEDILGDKGAAIYHERQNSRSLANALVTGLTEPLEVYEQRRTNAYLQYSSLFSTGQIANTLQGLLTNIRSSQDQNRSSI
jgi:glycosyltransferase involved in cell wall biosynthesis